MDNAILTLTVLIFGWLVLYSYGWKRGYKAGREDEMDANAKRFIHFSIERCGYRNGYTTRHENRFN